eukprot:5658923-Alexandrium_andersonii.AAC.1
MRLKRVSAPACSHSDLQPQDAQSRSDHETHTIECPAHLPETCTRTPHARGQSHMVTWPTEACSDKS